MIYDAASILFLLNMLLKLKESPHNRASLSAHCIALVAH